eukprot:256278-Ditylum_brightwellii.AAC.1
MTSMKKMKDFDAPDDNDNEPPPPYLDKDDAFMEGEGNIPPYLEQTTHPKCLPPTSKYRFKPPIARH